jgi:integrase
MIRKSLDVRSWEAAQGLVREMEIVGQAVPTVKEASGRFIEYQESRRLSPDTIQKFRLLFSEWELKGPINTITPDDVSKIVEGWKMAPSSANKKLERLRSFFKFCVERGWCDKSPAQGLRGPKETAIDKKPYEPEELEKITWAIPLFPIKGIYGEKNRERIAAFVAVLRWTGLRIRDVVQLKWSAVADGYITLRTHKNGKPVRLPVHQNIDQSLSKLPTHTEYIFWSGEGNPKSCVGDWQRTFRRLDKLAGVHIHAHRWRHTFATDLLSKGVPVSEVAAILGNSPRIVEKHYSHWISSRQAAIDSAVKQVWA